jgi:hypothetical protein
MTKKFLRALALSAGLALRLGAQVTDTPQTIEPGKFFLRMDAISLGFNRETTAANTFTALGLATSVLSTGLTQNVDMQVGMQFFLRQTYQFRGASTSHSGIGDVTLRTKWTFWRDNAAGAAAAVIPYVKVPTNSGGVGNDHVEGGVIVPWALDNGGGLRTGAMFQWDVLRNDSNSGYDSHWFASGFVQGDITSAFGLYGEATLGVSSASSSSFAGTLGGGATLNVTKNFQWDYGISRGLGGRATDWMHVLRLRWKF